MDPNKRYESKNLGTWSSLSDVDNFFNTHTPDNNWSGLKLGNYVTIRDGTFYTRWEIAGFNMEHNQLAADGTTYDNGYGICMIPRIVLSEETRHIIAWNDTDTLDGGYKASTIHNYINTTVANSLKTVLGNHLINRNVLLSNSVDSNNRSNNYEWTTAYCTLMSVGQVNGTFASHSNKYDDGEANYKLPLFNYEYYSSTYHFWTRCITNNNVTRSAWTISGENYMAVGYRVTATDYLRPLIYLR